MLIAKILLGWVIVGALLAWAFVIIAREMAHYHNEEHM